MKHPKTCKDCKPSFIPAFVKMVDDKPLSVNKLKKLCCWLNKKHTIEKLRLDDDIVGQVADLTDKLNEVIELLNQTMSQNR